ncbi:MULTISPECIES: CAP domain-containing protein [Neobacillus]|uniref:CAP domain-containing protein n=1 Tax=Neobacillus TaxID=2675232 RepID=UPI0027DD86B2|nr:CAP domain-containing protein [Neobacillus rhizophilus]
MVLSAVIVTIGFYVGINEKNQDKVLIKKDSTSEMEQTYQQNSNSQSNNKLKKPEEGLSLLIGKNAADIVKELGEPQRIDETPYGYQWYIYNLDFKRYVQVGIENSQVATIFVLGENLNISPFEIGQPVEEIFNTQFFETNINIDLNGNNYRFELNDTDLNLRPIIQLGDVFFQLYIDKFTGTLSSVRILNAETFIKQRPYELVYRGELIDQPLPDEEMWEKIETGAEQEIFDISNVLRQRYKLDPLKWDDSTAEVAFGHSKDMALNNDFSHTSKKFGSLADRLNKAEVAYKTAGENIAANYTDGPAAVEGWLNSKGHRDSLLNKEFTHLGVGVYQKYYTQNFIQKTEQ